MISTKRPLHGAAQSSRDSWQRELKNCASWHVCRDPQTSIVSFDDRTANCQAHTHPMRFSGIEGLENVLQFRWIQQERPNEVNDLLIEFLSKSVETKPRSPYACPITRFPRAVSTTTLLTWLNSLISHLAFQVITARLEKCTKPF